MRDLLRGVHLPSASEIQAERARRGAQVDGLPAGWERFDVCGPWMRVDELNALLAEAERVKSGGKSRGVLMVEAGSPGVPLVTVSAAGGVSGPMVERVHRRASIRYLLTEDGQKRGRRFDCVDELERSSRRRSECMCLVVAVEKAEEVEVDLARAVVCARGLARQAHRAWLGATRSERRRASRAKRRLTQGTPTSRPRAMLERPAAASMSPLVGTPSEPPSPAPLAEVRPVPAAPRRRLSARAPMGAADVAHIESIFGLDPENVYDASWRRAR